MYCIGYCNHDIIWQCHAWVFVLCVCVKSVEWSLLHRFLIGCILNPIMHVAIVRFMWMRQSIYVSYCINWCMLQHQLIYVIYSMNWFSLMWLLSTYLWYYCDCQLIYVTVVMLPLNLSYSNMCRYPTCYRNWYSSTLLWQHVAIAT